MSKRESARWPTEKQTKLEGMAFLGKSASQIAEELGDGHTRNSIIARCWKTGVKLKCPRGTRTDLARKAAQVRWWENKLTESDRVAVRILTAGPKCCGNCQRFSPLPYTEDGVCKRSNIRVAPTSRCLDWTERKSVGVGA